MSEWIKFSEKKPEQGGEYLVVVSYWDDPSDPPYKVVDIRDFFKSTNDFDVDDEWELLYWMPIPEIPDD